MLIGWVRRGRRDAGLAAPTGELSGDVLAEAEGLYVATTAHEDALNRLAIRGLAYRSRAEVTVRTDGIELSMPGAAPVAITREALRDAGRATVAIDRVVERGGLVRIVWDITQDRTVDLYLRLQQTSNTELLAAIRRIIPAPASTGADA